AGTNGPGTGTFGPAPAPAPPATIRTEARSDPGRRGGFDAHRGVSRAQRVSPPVLAARRRGRRCGPAPPGPATGRRSRPVPDAARLPPACRAAGTAGHVRLRGGSL